MLPPELMSRAHHNHNHNQQQKPPPKPLPIAPPLPPPLPLLPAPAPPPPSHVPAHGIDPTKIQLPCANCKAILNVPHGLARFNYPQCSVDLAVDVSKLKQFYPPPLPLQPPPPPPPEEVNEVAIEVEREEDEGGMTGETFTDYRPPKLSIGPPHPDPVVETSSLSAVQPPEPTYDLEIRDELETTKALSCLLIETLVYACQRHLRQLPSGARAGFFIGDGAGVGKGRTIAGLIWENWHCGRRKALWISVGSGLKFDARRDLDDVGATRVEGSHGSLQAPLEKKNKRMGLVQAIMDSTNQRRSGWGDFISFWHLKDIEDAFSALSGMSYPFLNDFLCKFSVSSASGLYKIVHPAVGESLRDMALAELKSKYRKISPIEKARSGLEAEYGISSKQCMHGPNCMLGNFCTVGGRQQEVNVLGGLILPVWGTIEKALSKKARQSRKRLRVVRIETTTDNQRIVGLFIPNGAVETVLQDLAWVQDIDD